MIDFEILKNAVSNLVAGAIEFTPRILTTLIILVVGWFISKLFRNLTQRITSRIGLDGAIERTGLSDSLKQAQITQSPSEMLGQFIFWLVFLNFVLVAFESLGLQAAVTQLQAVIAFLPRLLSALFVFIAGALLAQFVGRLTQAGVASMGVEFHQVIGQAVRTILLVVTAIVSVEQLGLDVTVLTSIFINLIAIITAGLALAFGLGGREVARNVLAGHYAREMYSPGNTLIIDEQAGTLEGIGSLNSEILLGEERLIIPNTRLVETQVKVRVSNQ